MAVSNTYASNTLSTLNGFFKEIYSNKGLQDLIPESNKLLQLIPFAKREQTLGNFYH